MIPRININQGTLAQHLFSLLTIIIKVLTTPQQLADLIPRININLETPGEDSPMSREFKNLDEAKISTPQQPQPKE